MISEITSEQDALLQNYRLKWQQRAFSLEPLHHSTVTGILNTAYRLSGYPEPKRGLDRWVLSCNVCREPRNSAIECFN
jgi:hypothetical protein